MSPEQMIAVIAAHSQGKAIEGRKLDLVAKGVVNWIEPGHVEYGFDFIEWEYRIKPEPREPRVIWVVEHPDGSLSFRNFLYEAGAVEDSAGRLPVRKFIEVIE